MTIGLFVAGVVLIALLAAGHQLMKRARAVPAARATESAPDQAEEREVQERNPRREGVLADPPPS